MIINKKIVLGITFFLIFSFIIPINANIDSPRKQMAEGVSVQDVICRDVLEKVIRTNGMPACVKPETIDKMFERGILLTTKVTKYNTEITTVPASSMSIVNFYVTDNDLNKSHRAVEVVSTQGLFEFTVNGIPIQGPEKMIETGYDTGQFYLKLELPETINGRQLSQDDIILIKYLDESDSVGEQRVSSKSVPLTKTFAKIETQNGGSRIGHEFFVRVFEPDANRDSKDEDRIPLNQLEFRSEGGVRTTLANPEFDANSNFLIETGPNTNIFEVQIKIPRYIDDKIVHIGEWYEIKYIDKSTPSNTDEKIIFKGRIG